MIQTEPTDVASAIELLEARGLTVLMHHNSGYGSGLPGMDKISNLASHVGVEKVVMVMPTNTPDEVFIEWEGQNALNNECIYAIKSWSPAAKGDDPSGQSSSVKVIDLMLKSIEVSKDLLHPVWYVTIYSSRALERTVVHFTDNESLAISIAQEVAFDINKLVAKYIEKEINQN